LPFIAISGILAPDADVVLEHGIDAVFSILPRLCSMEEAERCTADNLHIASRNIAATLKIAISLHGPDNGQDFPHLILIE